MHGTGTNTSHTPRKIALEYEFPPIIVLLHLSRRVVRA